MSAIMPFGLSLGNMVLWGLRGGGRSRSTMVSFTKGVPGCQTQACSVSRVLISCKSFKWEGTSSAEQAGIAFYKRSHLKH